MTPERYQQINALADAALTMNGTAREGFLQQACGSDRALLLSVSDLIRSYEDTDGFLEQPALETWASDVAASNRTKVLVGREVGRYLVLAHLGSGGIGDVWLAKDRKLTREVALKLLSPELAGDEDHVRRFQQEARAASRLNHPNLVTIFDIGEFEGSQFIAQEYVEGKTLREILAQGPMPAALVVSTVAQVATALATAHDASIIHRDIKPENIMIRPDGLVKVLDFGLARFLEGGSPSGVRKDQSGLTRPGFIIGTARYMSPEQARGASLDGRSDIFSLGVVMYEMLTGKSPFAANTPSDILAAILAREPAPVTDASQPVPEAVARIVHRCLAKEADGRFGSARELHNELSKAAGASSAAPRSEPTKVAGGGTRHRYVWAALGLCFILGLSYFWWRSSRGVAATRQVLRYALTLPPGQALDSLEISPRGDQIVYGESDGKQKLILRRFLDEEVSRPVAGSEGGEQPFFSPDGKQIRFYSPHALRFVNGSSWKDIVPVAAEFYLRKAFWGTDGNIYYTAPLPDEGTVQGLWRVPADGGKPALLLRSNVSDKGATIYFGQQLSGDRWLLCSSITGPLRRSIGRIDLSRPDGNATPSRIAERGMGGQLLPTGHLLYLWGGRLMAARYDQRRGAITGSPIEVLSDVAVNRWFGPKASVANDGTLAYERYVTPRRRLSWIDREGRETPLDLPTAAYVDAEVSPDGTKLSISRQDAQDRWTLWVVNLTTHEWTKVGETEVPLPKSLWSPDGKSLVAGLAKDNTDFVNLYRIPLNAPQNVERLTTQPDFGQYPLSWSASKNTILYVEGTRPGTQSDIFALNLAGRKTYPLVQTPSPEGSPTFSDDGQWFAYSSRLQTGSEILLRRFNQGTPARRISSGLDPLWSRDGKFLHFLGADGSLMQAPISGEGMGKPREVANHLSGLQTGWWNRPYSAAPDGRLLVIHNLDDSPPQSQIYVVVNWLEELKRAVP